MLLEKDKIRRIIRDHKITSFHNKDEEELTNILYEAFSELGQAQSEKLATKEDIKLILEMMDKRFEMINKRFETMDKRFEDMNQRFEDMNKRFEDMNQRFEDMNKRLALMFTFMNIGFGILVLITVLFKFLS